MGIPVDGRWSVWIVSGGVWTHPDVEVELVVCYGLDVESDGWYCGYDFADLVMLARIIHCILLREYMLPSICIIMLSCPRCPTFVISSELFNSIIVSWLVQVPE
jgi:hypothetical protein